MPSALQPRVFATADIGAAALDRLRAAGYEVEVYPRIEAPPYELILARVQSGIAGLITTLRDRIDEGIFAAGAAAGLKVVAQDAVGFDNIDRAAADRHRIPFTHTPGVLTDATAEFAFFILGAVARKLWPAEKLVREQRWGAWHPYHPMLGDEVTGKTVAVVGLGRIGRAFAQKCLGFAMHLLCVEPAGAPGADGFIAGASRVLEAFAALAPGAPPGSIRLVSLREALAAADFVSLHVPLLEGPNGTRHLINDETLGWMKPTAYLINTSRGPIVQEAALIEALRGRKIAGAGIDVYDIEPPPADHPYRSMDNVTLSPHLGYVTRETLHAFYSDSIEAVAAFLGGAPIRIANPEALERRAAGG